MKVKLIISSILIALSAAKHDKKEVFVAEESNQTEVAPKQDRCYGLALSDALELGPYQVGVLSNFLAQMASSNTTYDVVTGVGVGGLNAYLYSQLPKENELQQISKLKEFWSDITKQAHFELKQESFMYGYYFEDSLYQSVNVNQLLQKMIKNQTLARGLSIGITDILSGFYRTFNESTPFADMAKVIQATVNYAGVTPFVDAFKSLWTSGSMVYEVDINSILMKCQKLGYSESNITIDVILSEYISLHTSYQKFFGLIRAKQSHPEMEFRYIAGPTEEVASKTFPFDFNQAEVEYLYNLGKSDAKWAIENRDRINENLSPIDYTSYSPQSTSNKKSRMGNRDNFLE